jgi:hypothetical protein
MKKKPALAAGLVDIDPLLNHCSITQATPRNEDPAFVIDY